MSNKSMNRRKFLKALGAAGAVAFVGPAFIGPVKQVANGVFYSSPHGVGSYFQDYNETNVIFTTCEQCNTFCTIKAQVMQGDATGPYSSIIRKISGNQYSPITMVPQGPIPYDTPLDKAVKGTGDIKVGGRGFRGGRICLKGQAGIQTAYDSSRVRKPLKRVGERGSGKWKTITWDEAYDEIVNGSKDLGTPGLKDIWAYVPEKPVMDDWEKVKNDEMSFEEFDNKYKDVLIDTKHPDLGPKSNQIAMMIGDRRDFFERIMGKSLATKSYHHHGGICGLSSVMGNVHSYSHGKTKKRQYADIDHCLYLIVWGTNPLVANKGPTWLAPSITNSIENGMKMVVVDPRLSKSAEKANTWLPVKPGGDGALALAMGRWIIDNKRYDEDYLKNPNKQSAQNNGEPTWSDATHLVDLSKPNRPKLKASDLGIGTAEQYVVMNNGKPAPHDQVNEAELFVDTTVQGMKVKSAFQLYKERVMEKTLEEYAEICGIDARQIAKVAKEYTSYGKRAAVIAYRGPAKHGNGFYSQRAIAVLNHLIGNYDWKGGNITTGAFYKEWEGRYDLNAVPNANKAWGIPIGRYKVKYEKTTLFERDGYPAKRPWYPYSAHTVYEVLPSAADKYPYELKALITHRMSPILSAPNGTYQSEVLKNPKHVPLYVASDVQIGDTSQYADFILPDTTYLERWGRESIYPNIKTKFASVYQPVTRVYPDVRSFENSIIEILKAMNLPGVGENAFGDGTALHTEEDYYLKRIANIAYDETPVPDAPTKELETFEKARELALGKHFDLKKWKSAVKPEEWAKVVYVLNRGGRYEASGNEYIGDHVKYGLYGQADFYAEKVASGKDSYDGSFFDGLPKHEEIRYYTKEPVKQTLPLQLINWKARNIGTYRNISSAWLREVRSDNYIWMNPVDAKARGLKNGDSIKITASEFNAEGTVMVTGGIVPGVVGCAYNLGQSGYGVTQHNIDGKRKDALPEYGHTPFKLKEPMHEETGIPGGRGEGFVVNQLLMIDKGYKGGSITDMIGGSVAQLDVFVEIKKS